MRWIAALITFVLSAVFAHIVVINAVPERIMSKVQSKMAERGVPVNGWYASPRMTPQTQTVVRPSPDLSYAICRIDTSVEPVLLSAPTSETYGSLSVFDDRTNNVFVASLRDGSDFSGVLVHPPGELPEEVDAAVATVEMDGPGLALIRRLAPTAETHEMATALIGDAVCSAAGAQTSAPTRP